MPLNVPIQNQIVPKLRVLLIDDNPADLVSVSRKLEDVEDVNYTVHAFHTLKRALAFAELEQDRIDVCLVDYSLDANNTAFDFLLKCDEMAIRPLSVVVMTGQTDQKVDQKLMGAGVYDYWSKANLNSETLSRSLRYAWHRHQNYTAVSRESENKSRQIAHINHELKNPLNSVAGYSRVLRRLWAQVRGQDQKNSARIEHCFDAIETNCEYLRLMVADILELSELDINGQQEHYQLCDFKSVVHEVYQHAVDDAREANLKLNLNTPDDDVFIRGDHNKLYRVVSNLVSNAIKYTERGGATITLSHTGTAPPENTTGNECGNNNDKVDHKDNKIDSDTWVNSWALLTVQDTGVGIAKEDINKIFIEFNKIHPDIGKIVDSTGLGLAITKRLVAMHGGIIDVQSQKNQGSCFRVWLKENRKFVSSALENL